MFNTYNYIHMDNQTDARWQAEEDQKALELTEALKAIRTDAWDPYERDMEIYALQHELRNWGCQWDDDELREELTELYVWGRAKFARLYEGVYTTLHPNDLSKFINCDRFFV
jgi:hypothetical protein